MAALALAAPLLFAATSHPVAATAPELCTVTTSFGATNNSGWLANFPYIGGGNTYATALSGAGNLVAYAMGKDGQIILTTGQAYQEGGTENDPFYVVFESVVEFDTTAIPLNATVQTASVALTTYATYTPAPYTVELLPYNYGTLGTEDWSPTGGPTGAPAASVSTSQMINGVTTLLNGNLGATVQRGGKSQYMLTSSRVRQAIAPTYSEDIDILIAPITLNVTYTVPCVTTTLPAGQNTGYVWSGNYGGTSYSYGAIRAGQGALQQVVSGNTGAVFIGQSSYYDYNEGTTTYTADETFLDFDTSVLTGSSVISARLEGELLYNFSVVPFSINIRLDPYGQLNATDWVPGDALTAEPVGNLLSSRLAVGSNSFVGDFAPMVQASRSSGRLQLVLSSSRMERNNTPNGQDDVVGFKNLRLVVATTPN
jgi:hypothetical protein